MTHPLPIVFLVDDEPSVLKAVSRLLRAAGHYVRTFNSAKEFMECQPWEAHGCVVLDMAMPGYNGLDVQQSLAAQAAHIPIIFLTGHADVGSTIRAMRSGATDFLTKPVDEAQLLASVDAAIAKDRAEREATFIATELHRLIETLSPREYEVFTLVASGLLNKQTAAQLGTAEKTIKVHRARVMEKLKVDSLAGLVRLAERAGVASVATAE